MKGIEGRWLVVQSPSPDIDGSTRCHGNFPTFLETSMQSGVFGDLLQCSYELRVFCEVGGYSLLMAASVRRNQRRDQYIL